MGTAARAVKVLLPSTVLRLLCSRSNATTSLPLVLSCVQIILERRQKVKCEKTCQIVM